jgi:hypothetical protein
MNSSTIRRTHSLVVDSDGGTASGAIISPGWGSCVWPDTHVTYMINIAFRGVRYSGWRCAVTGADRVIRWTTAGAVVGVAAVAAVASYERAYALVRAHDEAGWAARLVPLTVDGLIYASSKVMLIRRAARCRFPPWRGDCSGPGDLRVPRIARRPAWHPCRGVGVPRLPPLSDQAGAQALPAQDRALLTRRRRLVSGQDLLLVLRGERPPASLLGHLRIRALLLAGHPPSISGPQGAVEHGHRHIGKLSPPPSSGKSVVTEGRTPHDSSAERASTAAAIGGWTWRDAGDSCDVGAAAWRSCVCEDK